MVKRVFVFVNKVIFLVILKLTVELGLSGPAGQVFLNIHVCKRGHVSETE